MKFKKKDAVKSAELQPCSVPLIRIRVGGSFVLFVCFLFVLSRGVVLFAQLNMKDRKCNLSFKKSKPKALAVQF